MNPITHFLAGWVVGAAAGLEKRDRGLVALAGVAPDLDGLGIAVDWITAQASSPTNLWGQYHHVIGHNLGFGLILTGAALAAARRRHLTAWLVLVSFHLHLIGDLVGARGPDGEQWPFSYLAPFSDAWMWVWSGQWPLNAWPNIALTLALLLVVFYVAWRRGASPLEMISTRAHAGLVHALRQRFGPAHPSAG